MSSQPVINFVIFLLMIVRNIKQYSDAQTFPGIVLFRIGKHLSTCYVC